MKINYKPSKDETKRKRKEKYLLCYPIEIQLEALTEAAMGDNKKLKEMITGLTMIRESLPYSGEAE